MIRACCPVDPVLPTLSGVPLRTLGTPPDTTPHPQLRLAAVCCFEFYFIRLQLFANAVLLTGDNQTNARNLDFTA